MSYCPFLTPPLPSHLYTCPSLQDKYYFQISNKDIIITIFCCILQMCFYLNKRTFCVISTEKKIQRILKASLADFSLPHLGTLHPILTECLQCFLCLFLYLRLFPSFHLSLTLTFQKALKPCSPNSNQQYAIIHLSSTIKTDSDCSISQLTSKRTKCSNW